MTAADILNTVRAGGGQLWLEGDKVHARLPESLRPLVCVIQECKPEIVELLSQRLLCPPESGCYLMHLQRHQFACPPGKQSPVPPSSSTPPCSRSTPGYAGKLGWPETGLSPPCLTVWPLSAAPWRLTIQRRPCSDHRTYSRRRQNLAQGLPLTGIKGWGGAMITPHMPDIPCRKNLVPDFSVFFMNWVFPVGVKIAGNISPSLVPSKNSSGIQKCGPRRPKNNPRPHKKPKRSHELKMKHEIENSAAWISKYCPKIPGGWKERDDANAPKPTRFAWVDT